MSKETFLFTWGPAWLLRTQVPEPYAGVVSREELGGVRNTALSLLSDAELESLVQAALSRNTESLLSQASTIAGLLRIEITQYPMLFAKVLRTALLGGPKTEAYARGVSTETFSAVLSTAAQALSDAEIESLVRAVIVLIAPNVRS